MRKKTILTIFILIAGITFISGVKGFTKTEQLLSEDMCSSLRGGVSVGCAHCANPGTCDEDDMLCIDYFSEEECEGQYTTHNYQGKTDWSCPKTSPYYTCNKTDYGKCATFYACVWYKLMHACSTSASNDINAYRSCDNT